jgi:hypothetical protein
MKRKSNLLKENFNWSILSVPCLSLSIHGNKIQILIQNLNFKYFLLKELVSEEEFLSHNNMDFGIFLKYSQDKIQAIAKSKIENNIILDKIRQSAFAALYSNQLIKYGDFNSQIGFLLLGISDQVFLNPSIKYTLDLQLAIERIEALKKHLGPHSYYLFLKMMFYFSIRNQFFGELVEYYFKKIVFLLSTDLFQKYGIDDKISFASLLVSLASWGESKKKDTSKISAFFEKIYSTSQNNDLILESGSFLASSKNSSIAEKSRIAHELIDKFQPSGLILLQLRIVIAQYEIESDFYQEQKIFDAISSLSKEIQSHSDQVLVRKQEKIRISPTINSLIYSLLNFSKVESALRLLSYFQNEKIDGIENQAIFVHNHQSGTMMAFGENQVIFDEHASEESLPILIDTTNKFFQLNIFLNDNSVLLDVRDRPGIVAKQYRELFIKNYKDVFNYRNLFSQIQNIANIRYMVSGVWPHQALMISQIETSFPINSSFQRPLPDRVVTKILFWLEEGFTMTSSIEIASAIKICEANQILYEIHNKEFNVEKFKEIYCSDEYDVIWLTTHSEFNHHNAHASLIHLSSSSNINLEAVIELKTRNTENRRLLFLNSCESAVSTMTDTFYPLGFGPLLSKNNQAVISHLWSVEPRVAMLYGLILLVNISKSDNFFQAYKNSVQDFLVGNIHVQNKLEEILGSDDESIKRLRNFHLMLNDLENYASLAFYE